MGIRLEALPAMQPVVSWNDAAKRECAVRCGDRRAIAVQSGLVHSFGNKSDLSTDEWHILLIEYRASNSSAIRADLNGELTLVASASIGNRKRFLQHINPRKGSAFDIGVTREARDTHGVTSGLNGKHKKVPTRFNR